MTDYIALIGKKGADLDEQCGYYGERLVLLAQKLGLNTCWVAMTFSKTKSAYEIGAGEKLCCVIALGYGKTQGNGHKVKSVEELCSVQGEMPKWFREGMFSENVVYLYSGSFKLLICLEEYECGLQTNILTM